MISRITLLCAFAVASTACSAGPGESTPQALREYITALEQERFADAYALTQLDEIGEAFGPGAAVTREHFIASWEAHPLASYEITEIIRLRKRDVDDFGEGDPYFETMVVLSTDASSWTANLGVEGEIVGTVIADAYPIRIEGGRSGAIVSVDGVALDVGADPQGILHLLVLGGRHEITIGARRLLVDAEPLAVIEGGVIAVDDPGAIRLQGLER